MKTVRDTLNKFQIRTVLDYGSGGVIGTYKFDESERVPQYFQLEEVRHYEPARNIDQRGVVDCVISFDVLERLYLRYSKGFTGYVFIC